MWPAFATLAGAVIALIGTVLKGWQPRLYKRLHRQAELWKSMPEGSAARDEIEEILHAGTTQLREREEARLGRVLNRTNLGGVFFFLITGVLTCVGLNWWAVVAAGTVWSVIATVFLFLCAFTFTLATLALATLLYKPKGE